MTNLFADTSYILALLNADDEWPLQAVELTSTIHEKIITTTWVLTEVVDALSRPRHREIAIEFVRDWQADFSILIQPPSQQFFDAGLDLFAERPDKGWSLTDCISFVAMKQHRLISALTADRHFEQAGFNILMK